MIKPTVGRVVWYYPSTTAYPEITDKSGRPIATSGDQPLAALVASVHNDRLVNLGGFDADGRTFSRLSVILMQEGDQVPKTGSYCTWMPYQIGQAKKHEGQ